MLIDCKSDWFTFFDLLQQDLFYLAECGKTKRNQMKIQLFIEFIYSVIYCIQLFLTMSTQSSVYTCCAALRDFVPWEARLRWKVRAYDTVSLCYDFNDKSLLKLRCFQITERERQLSVCWCVFFYECCHSYMHSWVSALMVTRLWYRHRWRSQQ